MILRLVILFCVLFGLLSGCAKEKKKLDKDDPESPLTADQSFRLDQATDTLKEAQDAAKSGKDVSEFCQDLAANVAELKELKNSGVVALIKEYERTCKLEPKKL